MKTAVILAARREKDSDIPYPLMPFAEGLCLLDRTLGILRELHFSNILIVVGYKAELFERYASDKITLIANEEFEFTASMGSLALARDYVNEDFLLIESDTFFERKVIERLCDERTGNCLTMTEESGSGDECYVETKNGFVTKISKDRHRVCRFEGEMIGVSRISTNTFERMLQAWEEADNPYLNYEYLLMDVTDAIDRPVVMLKNLIWGDVDCMEDFKKLKNDIYPRLRRRENPFDHDNLIMHLQQIFPAKEVSSAIITQIGGMSNKNFKVELDGRCFVLRVPGNGAEGMVERENEGFNATEACKMGVNPEIRYFNAETGIKLANYVENAETLNAATIQRHDNMEKIAKIYQTVHGSHIRLKNEFNIFHEIKKYEGLIKNAGTSMYEGWEEVRPKVMALEGYLNELGVELCPCHNDALYENFIKDANGRIFLIDWEYSGMNDPMADFAALFIEAGFTKENQDFMLERYFKGEIPKNAHKKILCYMILWDYLWAEWTVIKEANGDDFGTYGKDRYNRAIRNLCRIYGKENKTKTITKN